MKFDQLYNHVFLGEGDEEVAAPENFDDVEPMPLPDEQASVDVETPAVQQTSASSESSTIHSYIQKLDTYASELNNPEGESLQTFVTSLDRPGTPFEGISRTKADILRAAEVLRTTSEQLKSFLIGATALQSK